METIRNPKDPGTRRSGKRNGERESEGKGTKDPSVMKLAYNIVF